MKALNFVLQALDALAQLLVPPARNQACYRSFPDYADNAYFVFRHALRTRSGLHHVWLLIEPGVEPRIRAEFEDETRRAGTTGNTLTLVSRRSLRAYWLYLRSRWVFHTHGVYRTTAVALRGRAVVCLWHGMPIKCIGRLNRVTPNPYPTFGSVHVATSHFFRYVIAAAFAVPPGRVLVTPLPRTDALRPDYEPRAPRAALAVRLGVPPDRRWVLWMPTYRSELKLGPQRRSFLDDLRPGLMDALATACTRNGCTLIVKLHPFDVLNDAPPPPGPGHVLWLTAAQWSGLGVQLYELVAASDALLTDISSILIDYLPTGRPIGLMALDTDQYPRDLVFPVEYLLRSRRFARLTTPEEAQRFIEGAGRGDKTAAEASDIAGVFHDASATPGSEQILRHVGL